MKRVYISGKITGLHPQVSAGLFYQAAAQVRAEGNVALNPIEIWPQDVGWEWTDYISENLRLMLKYNVSEMLMLANWQESKGAKIEHAMAVELGIPISYQDEQTRPAAGVSG